MTMERADNKPTNAELLRSMTDDDLAAWLCSLIPNDCAFCPGAKHCRYGHKGLLDWLREEAKGEWPA